MPANTKEKRVKATIDEQTCIGCGLCAEMCPAVFSMNNEDIAVVTVDPVPAEAEDDCRDAAESCPVEAITIEE